MRRALEGGLPAFWVGTVVVVAVLLGAGCVAPAVAVAVSGGLAAVAYLIMRLHADYSDRTVKFRGSR